jgi:signal transduction histidine kinase/CheY-like chemotaxis protein
MLGKPISTIVPPESPEEIPTLLQKIARGERIEHYESVRVTKDGRRLDIALSIAPLRDASGKIVGASAIGRDITAQKRAEDQLRQAQKMEAVGRLAGGVAHDFNNILGIITACTELLRSRMPVGVPGSYIDNITKAAERGATLTRQLLAFSRKQVVQPTVLNLKDRLKEVTKLLRPLMGDDVEIVLNAKSQMAFIEADPGQLDQIVLNLAVNARDAMPRGGKLILESAVMNFDQVFADQHPPLTAGEYVLLAVSDTGMGMDEAIMSRIFEPFFTTKETGKGTGLGLATVYGIVKQAGGHILVYSEPGRGTTFRVYFPSAAHKIGAVEQPEVEAVPAAPPDTTILLVEDDELMRTLTRQMLEEHGYHVLEAEDGKSALDLVGNNHANIDLMLTDVVMRGLSGPQLVAKLHEDRPNLRVVYISGYTGELISEHDVLQPGIKLLEKPYTRSALLKTIHTALQ